MRKHLLSVLAIVSILAWSYTLADDEDIFTYGGVEPNVLILFDNSGSMDEEICSDVEDESEGYCWGDSGDWGDDDDNGGGGGWDDDPNGDTCRESTRVCETKLAVAKRTINNMIDNISGVRLGLMKMKTHGGTLVQPIGTAFATIKTSVSALTASLNSTPLGDSLYDAGQYFKGSYPGYATPIQYACQKNYVILMTDGEPNDDTRNPVSNVSTTLYATDHHLTFTGTQNVITHTIGIAIPTAAALLLATANNGHGTYAPADNARQVYQALGSAMEAILADNYAFAAPTIPSITVSGSDKVFLASFTPRLTEPTWPGYLRAFHKSANGTVPTDPNTGLPLDSELVWDASALLNARTPSTRTITTAISGAEQNFVTTNSAITTTVLNVSTSGERDRVIEFSRGIDKYDEDVDGNKTENRAFKLGDIFHSTPLLLFPPPAGVSTDPNYAAFQSAAASRPSVVLAGSNDGMLHAFNEGTGVETWAFVSPTRLSTLWKQTVAGNDHIYMVDGPPVAADVKTNNKWRTLVMFGSRRGSNEYQALDLTNTADPNYLWAFTDTKMGETWSTPAIGKVKISDGTTKYVAFVGGGYNTPSNNATGKALFVIDLANGAKLWEYYNKGSGSNDDRKMNFSIPATPTILDLDHDGFVDRVYVGDVGGQLWKFDTSAAATITSGLVTNWTGKRLFAADPNQANPPASGAYNPAQAMYGSPTVAKDSGGNVWVYIGTGNRNNINAASTNRFYGIKDNTNMTNSSVLTEANLVNNTSTDHAVTQGWYFTMTSTEKVMGSADVAENIVYFTSYTPTSAVTCTSGAGTAQLYAVQMATGYAGYDWIDNDYLTSSHASDDRTLTIGQGLPTEPNIFLENGTATVVVGTSTGEFEQVVVPIDVGVQVLYWREVM